jgi:hypothetical protein
VSRRERQLLGLLYSSPRNPDVDKRKERFAALAEFVQGRGGGWLTSVPGAAEVTMECLPGSGLPDDLRALGYDIIGVGDGERILAYQMVERFADAPMVNLSR